MDPDYVSDVDTQSAGGYQGYLRVHFQQLIHNFYVVRRWHAKEISLKDLWKAAQKDLHYSFFSMEDEEIFAWDSPWEVVTALRASTARERAARVQ